MSSETLKPLLLRDKHFLEELYMSQSIPAQRRIVTFASDQKLKTIIKVIHCISNGEIKVKREHFEQISKRFVTILRRQFERKASLNRLLNSEREVKVKLLNKVCPILKFLLYPLFNVN